jgi:GTP-binding protein
MSFIVAIVGRPNVGKSTLFNRLVGQRVALVDDEPGVTRDRRRGGVELHGLSFDVVDTAGLEDVRDESLWGRMRRQTEQAVEEADLVLFLVDARAGVTPFDAYFANWLRGCHRPVVLVANKCEGRAGEAGLQEAFALGLGEPLALSAEHGLGIPDLCLAIEESLKGTGVSTATSDGDAGEADSTAEEERPDEEEVLRLAIVGRPNVGKSTLINRLLGEERVLTGPEPGITRDAISVDWTYQGRRLRLFDTAGMRKKARVTEKLEKLSVAETLRAIRFAHVVVVLLDADAPLERQELGIARRVVDEGRALVIALNKWDACADRAGAMTQLRDRLERSLPQTKGIPVVAVSALQGRNLEHLMKAVFAAYGVWQRRVPTAALNRWLDEMTASPPPPAP